MNRPRIEDLAKGDLRKARRWYDKQRRGLGLEFLAEVRTVIRTIGVRPESFPEIEQGFRYAMAGRFPYKVVFAVLEGRVHVFAVIHGARHPEYWQTRRDDQDE